MRQIKDEIIFHVMEFMETGDMLNSHKAKNLLKDLSKTYHIKIKKQIPGDLKLTFMHFILNEKGYNTTIDKLYNSL